MIDGMSLHWPKGFLWNYSRNYKWSNCGMGVHGGSWFNLATKEYHPCRTCWFNLLVIGTPRTHIGFSFHWTHIRNQDA